MKELNDGNQIPEIGFGTYPLRGEGAVAAVASAIDLGYRLIDTAFNYDNEAAVGRAIAESAVPREQLFITSKLPGRFHQRPSADDAIKESLWSLRLDYMDLYLIHWPNPIQGHFVEAWQSLVDAQAQGLVRSIGVSNFTDEHVAQLVAATGVTPAVNQIELHPYFPQQELLAQMQRRGTVVEAWSPLARSVRLFEEPVIAGIAREREVSPAQVVLRWDIQRGVVPIPKSASPARQASNLDVFGFELTKAEIDSITNLGRPGGRTADLDPNSHEEM